MILNHFKFERSKIMAFIDTIYERAKADKQTIVLPESMDKRTYEAAEKILKLGIANLVIIGTPEEIAKNSEGFDLISIESFIWAYYNYQAVIMAALGTGWV